MKLENEAKNDQNGQRCGNCGMLLKEGESYCRICGTQRGIDQYLPDFRDIGCIYGPPPIKRDHHCEQCGYHWTTYVMIDSEKTCPKCRGYAPVYDPLRRAELSCPGESPFVGLEDLLRKQNNPNS